MSITQYHQRAKSLSDESSATGRTITPAEFNAIIYRNIGAESKAAIYSASEDDNVVVI